LFERISIVPKVSIDRVIEEAARAVNAWKANPDFTLAGVTLASFDATLRGLQVAVDATEAKKVELTGLMNARDDKAKAMSDIVTRIRSGFRATYGPDSSAYEQVGGTRRSERRSPKRPPKP
jgi:hypothetical protein